MSSVQTLVDMGFSQNKAQKAMELCNNNVEQAMEWLLAHTDDPPMTEEVSDSANANVEESIEKQEESTEKQEESTEKQEESTEKQEEVAKSIKCDECQKLFRTSEEVEFHAVKSGHSSFSESTEEKRALSEEEKKEKLRQLEEKIKQRRLEKEETDKKISIEKEKLRINQSRQAAESKKKNDEMEIKKLVEERKREKMEDKLARQRVKDQIESDRKARKEREQMFSGDPSVVPSGSSSSPVASQAVSITQRAPKKEYDSTRLQIRLPSGTPLIQNFNSKESLSAVRLWVSLNRTDGISPEESFNLSTTFPRKIFSEEEMEKPLSLLGLVPSAVLAVTK